MRTPVVFHAAAAIASSCVLLAITSGGCSAAAPAPAPAQSDRPLTGNTENQGAAPAATAATAATPGTPSDCEDLGNLAATGTAKLTPTEESLVLPLENRPVPSRLGIIASGNPPVGVTVTLGQGADANYATCAHCIVIAVDCQPDCKSATWFYPRAGSARFSKLGASFEGTFTDVVFEQVSLDWSTMHSTPVKGGGCFKSAEVKFSAATEAPVLDAGPTTSGGTSSGSTTTSSGTSGSSVDAGTSGVGTSGNGASGSSSSGGGDSSSGGVTKNLGG